MVSLSWLSVALFVSVTVSKAVATIVYTQQTAIEGDVTPITFHLQKPIWEMTLHTPLHITEITWTINDTCLYSGSSHRWIYNKQCSNATLKTFILLNVQQSDNGTWHLLSHSEVLAGVNIRVTKSSDICRSPNRTIPVLNCSASGIQQSVLNGSPVRLLCPISGPFSLEFGNGRTLEHCAKTTQCRCNYCQLGIVLDLCNSNSNTASFIIPHVNSTHNGTWSFISSVKLTIIMEVIDTHCTDTSSPAPVTDASVQSSVGNRTAISSSHHPIPQTVLVGLTLYVVSWVLGL